MAEVVTSTVNADPRDDHHVRAGLDAALDRPQIIRTAAMLQLLLGNVGMPGGGMNALRGHSNIQGATDLGTFEPRSPGYLKLPAGNEQRPQATTWRRGGSTRCRRTR